MNKFPGAEPAAYYDLAGDVAQLQGELRTAVRNAWMRGAATATLFLVGGMITAHILGIPL